MGLKTRIDPPRSFTPEEAQQWYKLLQAIESELGVAGLSNTLFVDAVDGDNDTAQRGSLVFKYQTIQAALDAALDGDTIFVSPGIFSEDLVWPDTQNITLKGTGKVSTSISNATAGPTLTIAPTIALGLGSLNDLAVSNTGANPAISIDGSADPAMFAGTFRVIDCLLVGAVNLQSINDFSFRDTETNSALSIQDCGDGVIANCKWNSITDGYVAAPANPPMSGPGTITINGTNGGVLTVNGLARVRLSKDTEVTSVGGALLDALVELAPYAGYIEDLGYIGGAINVTFNLQQADAAVCVFDFAKVAGLVTIADSGAGANRGSASFRNAELLDKEGPHTAGNLCDMDLRGCVFAQPSLAVAGNGAIDRSVWTQVIPAGNSGAPVAWGIPYVTAPQYVGHECADVTEMPIAITTKSATQVAYTKGAGDAADVVVCAQKDFS